MLVRLLLVPLYLSREIFGAASIVCRLGQTRLSPHLLTLLGSSVSLLGGVLNRLVRILVVV